MLPLVYRAYLVKSHGSSKSVVFCLLKTFKDKEQSYYNMLQVVKHNYKLEEQKKT